ncbi:hypothetical protein ACFPIF_07395 [Brevundimonas faecalis]|uniref:hypothetical protein n=1 Tax=Brevundimonas faecalis TaxID=947378 RepID=UPI003616514C
MHPLHFTLLIANAVGLAWMLRRGGAFDRAAILTIVGVVVTTSVLQMFYVPGMLIWAAVLDVLQFFILWLIAERARRWWIVFCAGFVLIAVLAHAVPFIVMKRMSWAVITVNWAMWTMISISILVGLWEIAADRRFLRERRDGEPMEHGSGA